MNRGASIRWLLLLTSAIVTFGALALALPPAIPEINLQGATSVNQAPAVRIRLASPQKPAPQPETETFEPEPQPQPEPEPEPEPESKPEPEPESKPEPKPEPKLSPAPQPVPESETLEEIVEADASKSEEPSEDVTEKQAEEENASQQVELSAGDSSEVDSYLTELSRHLSRFYEYPRRSRRLGQEGSPVVVFEFNRDGTLVRHSIGRSSDHSLLDDAALDMLKAAEPLPAVPESMRGESFTYALPVRFSLR
ncbi:energy transducer TonB [Marinobacter sp.]|uniref:energy transducer TonB n=1 Tax=Marinobacter sp. TaxID=50741 RepID=UPI0023544B23|nr:energy transducer TonB [Marinobacter sp.]